MSVSGAASRCRGVRFPPSSLQNRAFVQCATLTLAAGQFKGNYAG